MGEPLTLGDVLWGIRWTDLVDILVVAACIYALLRLVTGTRALNLLLGLGLLMCAKFAAQVLHLYSFEWLLNLFMAVGVAAVVILFQPELRRALEHLGRGARPRLQANREEPTRIVREILAAVSRLSATRTGALIAVEKRTGLREYAETGLSLAAEVSARLLLTLFHAGTPVHDGAVILSRDRIEAAGCVLPLSQGIEGGLTLGTRHRAALGLTEVSDAVVVVVSEETGLVSWVRGGRIERGISLDGLESRLREFYGLTAREAAPAGAMETARG